MTVPKGKRSTSKFEVYAHAVKMRTELTKWLLRDFGVKRRPRTLEDMIKQSRMSWEDSTNLKLLVEKYNLGDRLLEDFPSWWIEERRRSVDRICSRMIDEISASNTIFVTNENEYYERRTHQTRALSVVFVLLNELQYITEILNTAFEVDIVKLMPFVEMCNKEIELIKQWRTADNSIKKRLGIN